ncbi:MAG TPA: MASE4 domain-containing protein [Bauldia sp.]|nr:MASE4 domain-containing protein [Bauldia sp.]
MAMRADAEPADLAEVGEPEIASSDFLANATASRSQRRLALVVVGLSLVLFVALLPLAKVKLAQIPAFIPAYESALVITDLVTAVLLLGQFIKLRSRAMLALAAGYLFDALIAMAHGLSFPGGFGPSGVIGGGNQTTVWLYAMWHAVFPLFVIAYALLKDDDRPLPAETTRPLAIAAGAFVAMVVGAMVVAVTVFHDELPPLLVNGNYSPTYVTLLGAAWVLSIGAAVLLLWRGLRSVLDVWVAVVMCVWVMDVALSAVFNAARYDLGFYAGRFYGLLAGTFVLAVLLLETSGLLSHMAEAAEALRGQAVRLKGTVRESLARQQEIENQLRQAQKMEAIGNLTGGMAHDFNNLLGVVIGNLDLMLNRTRDGDLQELGNEARDAALQGADLTRRLLAFARRQPLQPQLVAINDLVSNHAQLLRRLLGAQIEVRLHLDADVWSAIVDPTQLEAAITNLATNARDAMPGGGILTIATGNRHLDADYAASHPEVVAGDYALIEVTDSGSGIPPEVLARVFEPFFTTKEVGKGTGLGLSMVYGFMKQSKGHVSVYSEPGVGTTFRLYLPRFGEAVVEAAAAPAGAEDLRGNGETVLAVEDVDLLRKVVVRQLDELGYKVLTASNADEAIVMLAEKHVDVLFTDVILAGGATGFDLARVARQRWPNLKVVFTSGFPDTKLNTGSGPTNVGKLLGKPFRKEDLAKALKAALTI